MRQLTDEEMREWRFTEDEERRERLAAEFERGTSGEDVEPPSPTKSGLPRRVTTLEEFDARTVRASLTYSEKCVALLARTLNANAHKDQIGRTARVLLAEKWTEGEVSAATRLIAGDAVLGKEVQYAGGAVTPTVFAMARERPEVKAGRTLAYREMLAVTQEEDWEAEPVQVDGKTRWILRRAE